MVWHAGLDDLDSVLESIQAPRFMDFSEMAGCDQGAAGAWRVSVGMNLAENQAAHAPARNLPPACAGGDHDFERMDALEMQLELGGDHLSDASATWHSLPSCGSFASAEAHVFGVMAGDLSSLHDDDCQSRCTNLSRDDPWQCSSRDVSRVEINHTRESDLLCVVPSVVLTPSSVESRTDTDAAGGAQGALHPVSNLCERECSTGGDTTQQSHGGMESMLREFDALLALSTDGDTKGSRSDDLRDSRPAAACVSVAHLGPRLSQKAPLPASRGHASGRIAGFASAAQRAGVHDAHADPGLECASLYWREDQAGEDLLADPDCAARTHGRERGDAASPLSRTLATAVCA